MTEQEKLLMELARELGLLDKKCVNLKPHELKRALYEYDTEIRKVLYSLHINIKGKHRLDNMVKIKDPIFFIKNGLRNSMAVYDYDGEVIYGNNCDGFIYLSLLHEDIHYLGRHGDRTGIYNIKTQENEAFNECITEFLTRIIFLLMTEEDVGYTAYDAQIEVLEPFFAELGLKTLLDIYFNNKIELLQKIFEKKTGYSWKLFNEQFDATLRNPVGIEETIYAELDTLKSILYGTKVAA